MSSVEIRTFSTSPLDRKIDFYSRVGKIGGLKKVPKGFAFNRELAARAGALGGSISKRTKK